MLIYSWILSSASRHRIYRMNVRIERVHRDKLPAGTKILTENEVFEHYVDLIQEWKPASEVYVTY